jgi:hypothetical protein
MCTFVVLLRHCFLVVLSSASALVASKVVSLLLSESDVSVLLDGQREWQVVSMLFGEIQSDALARPHHWLQAFGVRPCESSAKLQQAFLALFPVCAQPRPWHVLLVFLTLSQGMFPPL